MRAGSYYETFKGEQLKAAAELTLHGLGGLAVGREALEAYAFGVEGRPSDARLHTSVAGVAFENPVIVGAGWDKKGRAIHGLYQLGFSGVEIGTVLPFAQTGNPRPRLWTINQDHSVGLNRLGFNSPGMERVGKYLQAAQPLPCPVGLNVGRNKIMPNEMAAWAHNQVIEHLGSCASYIVLGISSPNSPGLRGLQDKGPFRELVQAAREAMPAEQPLFIKIDSERTPAELDDMIEVMLEEKGDGFVATNTYMASDLKAKYGRRWANEAGGLSGADPDFRRRATGTVRHIYEAAGDRLAIIGVGAVGDTGAALEKLEAGASAVQVVTAIRPSLGRVAAQINRGLLDRIERDGASSIRDYIGAGTTRGVLAT
ncbi:MAG TPA: dihydroorotate dehydrogenase (quinone) [Candidatus Saccharimonadales bacterium]|nr:dihydroorotate dehydrogenase (quinone) [Candidatus Saccharimonadales bacterium]